MREICLMPVECGSGDLSTTWLSPQADFLAADFAGQAAAAFVETDGRYASPDDFCFDDELTYGGINK